MRAHGREVRRGLSLGGLVLIIALAIGAAGVPQTPAASTHPNIIFLITDDQAARGTVNRMPWLNKHRASFVDFTHAFVNNPLCCPSRATILSGRYSHHTGVETSHDGRKLNDSRTIATWLNDAGYTTALFGKYLNYYPWGRGPGFVPPGWDRFTAFNVKYSYYDYDLRTEQGTWEHHGFGPENYSGRVLSTKAQQFVRTAEPPFFAYIATWGPHHAKGTQLSVPDPRDDHLYDGASVTRPANFNRKAEGAPRWWRDRTPVSAQMADKALRTQWETIRSADRALRKVVVALKQRGELDNTVIVFTSDNGYSFGSHRWMKKQCAYDECAHVPLLIKAPGITGRTVNEMVGNQDLAPTLATLGGAAYPDVDGQNLVPLLRGQKIHHRPQLLRNIKAKHAPPTYWALRTDNWKLVEQANGKRELYNLQNDPRELTNLAGKRDAVQRDLARRLRRLR
jgi:arylsulfatase A-like enzyme